MSRQLTVEQLRCLEISAVIRKGLEGIKFDMRKFKNHCGTAGCIGGYTVAVYDPVCWAQASNIQIRDRAAKLLGLSPEQKRELFFGGNMLWEDVIKITPDMAAAALDSLAMTGKVKWPQA